jgi:imidazole glycerol phosphate synthase glutamine amidotransferase subunit
MIVIIDYGAGNLLSIKKAFDYLGIASQVVANADALKTADKVVLPGVGAFGAAIKKLQASGFYETLRDYLQQNRPFLGICLGMHMLFEKSAEAAGVAGLHRFAGECLKFNRGKVPQIGWNQVAVKNSSAMFAGIPDQTFFYFIHGYYVQTGLTEIVTGRTDYHLNYVSAIESGNIWAVQFHPEKSGVNGLKLLKNWVQQC